MSDPYADAQDALIGLVRFECERRHLLYDDITPRGLDDTERIEALFLTLDQWAADPVQYCRDVGWAPDPKGRFGGLGKMGDLAPPMMVPIIPSPAQANLLWALEGIVESGKEMHGNLLKSRQLACTTLVLNFIDRCNKFKPGFAAALSSYDEVLIDPGGSGHRDVTSLFSRLRMMMDAVCWGLPQLAYNQNRSQKWITTQREKRNACLFAESQDAKMKIVRPPWVVYQREIFPQASGNVISGAVPGEKFKQGDIMTFVLLDEYGLYNVKRPGMDKTTRASVKPACDHIFTMGTIPDSGGLDSDFKSLSDTVGNPTLVNLTLDWSDVFAYIIHAVFKCDHCGSLSRYHKPGEIPDEVPGPGPDGVDRDCSTCGKTVTVRRFSAASIPKRFEDWEQTLQPGEITSPWWNRTMAGARFDRTELCRFYLRNWVGSAGDRAFFTFDRARAVVARDSVSIGHEWWRSVTGFDPGGSETNPAAWVMVRFSEKLMIPRIVGWHMAAHQRTEWWTPFFKQWSASRMDRQQVLTGADAGKLWSRVYHYTKEERAMLDHISLIRVTRADRYTGDKYGSHKSMTYGESEYDILEKYNVFVEWEYSSDREVLLQRFRDLWCPRLEVDPFVARHRPMSPRNEMYPTIVDCLDTARMRTTQGQNEARRDIDKNHPANVSHPIDALLYITRLLPEEITATADPSGNLNVNPERQETAHVCFGEGGMWE